MISKHILDTPLFVAILCSRSCSASARPLRFHNCRNGFEKVTSTGREGLESFFIRPWSGGRTGGQSCGRAVGLSGGRSGGPSVGLSDGRTGGRMVARTVGRSVGRAGCIYALIHVHLIHAWIYVRMIYA